MCRRLRTSVPTIRSLREPEVPDKFIVSQRDKKEKDRQKTNFDSCHQVTDLKPLSQGDCVWLPDQQNNGQVVSEDSPRSYNVETPSGFYRRNRRHIIPMTDTTSSKEQNPHTQCSHEISEMPRITQPANDTDVVKTRSGWLIKVLTHLDTSWT